MNKTEEEMVEQMVEKMRRDMESDLIRLEAENLILKQILEQILKIELIPKFKGAFA